MYIMSTTLINMKLYEIQEHLPPQIQESFDFQIYINRALEEDFKVIVGIRLEK